MQAASEIVVAPGGLYLLCVVHTVPSHDPDSLSPWNFPPGQMLQAVCACNVAPTVPYLPGGQETLLWHVSPAPVEKTVQQLSNPLEGEYFPDGHSEQTPISFVNFPGGHPAPLHPAFPS
tara:strand:- start:3658 stop:4014 length:357 start_codon:yes stop_codon:yes gene_type:complete